MEITDEKYSWLSEQVYWVENNRRKVRYHPIEGGEYNYNPDNSSLGKFKVIEKPEDNPKNGMQAMAVAPMVNGKEDTSQIVIAYAGTNVGDIKDRATDIQMIGGGDTENVSYSEQIIDFDKNDRTQITISDSQAKTALEFAATIRKKYRNSRIVTTGHSLGESTGIYVALKNGWDNVGFNGPDTNKMLSPEEVEYIKAHPEQFQNYRNWYDYIGGITGNDTNSAIHHHYGGTLYAHDLSDWKTNASGKVAFPDGEVVFPSLSSEIDINNDGVVDMLRKGIDLEPRDLLSGDESYITSDKAIIVHTESLRTLVKSLRVRIREDIFQMKKLTQLCIEKNQTINKDFETRKQDISEKIQEVFKQAGFPALLQKLNDSVDVIIQNKNLFERGAQYAELRDPFMSHQTPMQYGIILNKMAYNTQLEFFRSACEPIVTQISQEKTATLFSYFFGGEQTLLGSWQIIETATKDLLKASDQIFEGEGLRVGKKDGISDSLNIVLEIIKKIQKN